MTRSPKISAVVTCRDLGKYLPEALDSVRRQTLRDHEIIVVDDASAERETVEILSRLDTPETRLIRVKKRCVSAARNCGIREARGEYICCLDADDILRETFLEKTAAALDGEPEAGFAGCWVETFGEEETIVKHGAPTLVDFLGENHAPGSSLFRREAWEKVGGYDERLAGCEDWEFWINLVTHGYRCLIVQEPLFLYRVRRDSKVHSSLDPANRPAIVEVIIRKHERAFRENLVPVLLYKERLIGELADWTRKQEEAKRWFLRREKEYERSIRELREGRS